MPSVADTNASLHGVIAALAALHMRGRTGVGQHIDIAMTDAMLTTDDYSHHALDDFPILRVGGDVWEAPGGQLLTAGLFELNWQRMSASYPDVFAPDAAGYADAPVRMAAVQRWISDFPGRSELLEALDTAGVPWADVRQPMDVFDSDWARARQTCAEIDDRAGGTRRVVQSPYKYSDAHSGLVPRIAFRGEDNETALRRWLDVDADELEELATAGVLLAESVGAPED
jgi:Predicted acyl-CoA transferases/carnitine dehydratase